MKVCGNVQRKEKEYEKAIASLAIAVMAVMAGGYVSESHADPIYPQQLTCSSDRVVASQVTAMGMSPWVQHQLWSTNGTLREQRFDRPAPLQWWTSRMLSPFSAIRNSNVLTNGDRLSSDQTYTYCAYVAGRVAS
ncbi:hypothetical protein GCM10009785_24180 [Brooklawnia cerclae]